MRFEEIFKNGFKTYINVYGFLDVIIMVILIDLVS